MPATLGDHRGVIKATVTVVNRAANKGGEGRKRGREGWDGCRQGRFNGRIVFPFACCFFFFFLRPSLCGEIYAEKRKIWLGLT